MTAKNSGITEFSQTLIGLVDQYSPTGEEREASEWLLDRMTSIGYSKSYLDSVGNAIGIIGEGLRQIMFLGHIDTVPGKIPVRIIDKALQGRGSVDAKGSLAAFVDAVAQTGAISGWQFIVIGAVDEEGDSKGARALINQFKPDYCIVGEPSQWDRLALGYKGSATAQISTRKPTVHSARLDESACESLLSTWISIQGWVNTFNLTYDRFFEKIQPSIRCWASGEDEYEEWAKIQISTRLPPGFNPQQWYSTLEAIATDVKIEQVGYPVSSFLSSKNTPLVKAFLKGIRNSGGNPVFVYKTGTSDANIIAQVWNCPIVVYGPGDSNLDHTPQEHILLEDYNLSVKVLKDVIQNIVNND